MYEKVLKPLFFLMSPERAHYAAMDLLVFASRVPGVSWWMKRRAPFSTQKKAFDWVKLRHPGKI